MHREIQIKQFPIVTTHWWPKTRNERFVWENEQYFYRFIPLVHNHVQVIWVRTRIRCVTCVRALWLTLHSHGASASTLDGGRVWSVVLTRRHSYNNQSHTSLVLHEWDWVFAWGDLIGWRLRWRLKSWKVFNFCREQRQWSDATDPQFSSATLDVTPFKVNERRWRRRPVWMLVCASAGKRQKWSLARIRHSLPERTHTPDACAHSDHLDMVVYKR